MVGAVVKHEIFQYETMQTVTAGRPAVDRTDLVPLGNKEAVDTAQSILVILRFIEYLPDLVPKFSHSHPPFFSVTVVTTCVATGIQNERIAQIMYTVLVTAFVTQEFLIFFGRNFLAFRPCLWGFFHRHLLSSGRSCLSDNCPVYVFKKIKL
jgi:hypothetical protein